MVRARQKNSARKGHARDAYPVPAA
jgi:hypothetical protein